MRKAFIHQGVFSELLTDTCDIYENVARGEEGKSLEFYPWSKYGGHPCRISGAIGAAPTAKSDSANDTGSVRVFFTPDTLVSVGDILHVTTFGKIIKLEVVLCHQYENHIETAARRLWEG